MTAVDSLVGWVGYGHNVTSTRPGQCPDSVGLTMPVLKPLVRAPT